MPPRARWVRFGERGRHRGCGCSPSSLEVSLPNETALPRGAVVWIDIPGGDFGKVLDMRTHNGKVDYLIEHPPLPAEPGQPPSKPAHSWIAAEQLQVAEGKLMP